MIYIDTSVLAAYYCPEALSDKVEEILLNTKEPAVSQLTEIELASAISRKIREHTVSKEDAEMILSLFQTHIDQKSFIYLPIQTKHYEVDPMSRPIFAFFKLHSDLVMQDDFVLFCINYLT